MVDVDWPYSDRTGSKVRPAVVVQADFLNGLIDDAVLVQITTSARFGIPGTEVQLDPAHETSSGLTRPCVANCMNILTHDQLLVLRTVGYLSDGVMRQIEACLKVVLEIP